MLTWRSSTDMKEHFVIDPLISKRQQLLLATQLCRMVLKVCIICFVLYCLYSSLLPHPTLAPCRLPILSIPSRLYNPNRLLSSRLLHSLLVTANVGEAGQDAHASQWPLCALKGSTRYTRQVLGCTAQRLASLYQVIVLHAMSPALCIPCPVLNSARALLRRYAANAIDPGQQCDYCWER